MSSIGILSARQWVHLLGLGLALVVVIVAAVAVVLPVAGLILALALLTTGVALAAQGVRALARAPRAAGAQKRSAESTPQRQLQLELAEGIVRNAWAVPLPGDDEHTFVLTRDGYLVVSSTGKVIHRYE